MKKGSIAFARYWRNSLADADLGHGGFSEETGFDKYYQDKKNTGYVSPSIVENYFANEPEHVEVIEVTFRPLVYLARVEHGKARQDGVPQIMTPVVTPALLARDGRLYPSGETIVPRDLLEPLQLGAYTVGKLSDLDTFLSTDGVPTVDYSGDESDDDDLDEFEKQWEDYWKGYNRLMDMVCPDWPDDEEAIEFASYGFLSKKSTASGFSQNILGLYDQLCEHSPSVPLFERYAREEAASIEPCLSSESSFTTRLGHSSDSYPLAEAQRDALTHLLACRHGDILAVNGPPGTGKTTLLLSVVATLWAKAALEESEPPVILAASTNNQAVTNIIDAFGKDFASGEGPFANRWLPDVRSFGAYFASRRKKDEVSEKYQTQDFFDVVESREYFDKAKAHYLAAANDAFVSEDTSTVEKIVEALHRRLEQEARKLKNIEAAWKRLIKAQTSTRKELGNAPQDAQDKRIQKVNEQKEQNAKWKILKDKWEEYRASESIWYSLFNWIPAVAQKRPRLARQYIKAFWPGGIPEKNWDSLDQIEAEIDKCATLCARTLHQYDEQAEKGHQVLQSEGKVFSEWIADLAPLGDIDISHPTLSDVDKLADSKIRFEIFRLTTHYWEGRWLLEMEELLSALDDEKTKKSRAVIESRWRRRMMLTPCVVSTFFMLPQEMTGRHKASGRWENNYLYDFADLLIVDEAGQVLPEVAGASFALAKKALVIGDTLQIEPIWTIPEQVDKGNLANENLLDFAKDPEADYDYLIQTGKLAACGSVMRIAQQASRWHYDPDLARGMFLYEHRRCFDEIIGYSNTLCYHGKLAPMRGNKSSSSDSDQLPAMGYLHIDGICLQREGGSRKNQLEAETIAAWLKAKQVELEEYYAKPLSEIVGVVTPFAGQVQAIMQACRKEGIAVGNQVGEMTVGTVHSLQGAERPVIIFSTVYSKHPNGNGSFIDRSPSMLNVAVSRAKNAFLVFGDMDVLGQASPNSPRGKLAQCLFADDANALQFEYRVRHDLVSETGLKELRNANDHDAFLLDTLSKAHREVHIVTPWIRPGCIEEIGVLDAMVDAVNRGVKVHVYSDHGSNTFDIDPERKKSKQQEYLAVIGMLRASKINPIVVRKVHSKIVIGDEDTYCVGSFNWFSAQRDESKQRHETSLVYRGPKLVKEISAMKESLKHQAISLK